MTLFAAHLLGDFVFQSAKVAMKKSRMNRQMIAHMLIQLFMTSCAMVVIVSSSPVAGGKALAMGIALVLFHWIVDMVKVELDALFQKRFHYFSLFSFVIDQALHVFAILIALFFLKMITPSTFVKTAYALIKAHPIALTPLGHMLAVGIMMLLATRFSGFLVGKLVGPQPRQGLVETEKKLVLTTVFPSKEAADTAKSEVTYMHMAEPDPGRGALIGYLERLIVMFLVCGQAYAAIAFIATAKSLVRFKQMEHREWAEYFLVGTLSSMLLGLLAGHILRALM
ncbi:DUF3307 domain-containing protein [Alicyclobacillus fodiniaquatilis]|uniref:DUF3307 domain-containing protein n=1 Tax=Alicyclobacillus fodiniaquatilis TaxID=1661150 RepID=A0ABW4JGP5_9BACL